MGADACTSWLLPRENRSEGVRCDFCSQLVVCHQVEVLGYMMDLFSKEVLVKGTSLDPFVLVDTSFFLLAMSLRDRVPLLGAHESFVLDCLHCLPLSWCVHCFFTPLLVAFFCRFSDEDACEHFLRWMHSRAPSVVHLDFSQALACRLLGVNSADNTLCVNALPLHPRVHPVCVLCVYLCTFVCVFLNVCIYVCKCTHIWERVWAFVCLGMYSYMCVFVCACSCLC